MKCTKIFFVDLLEAFHKFSAWCQNSRQNKVEYQAAYLISCVIFLKFKGKQDNSPWIDVNIGVPQESILSSLITLEIHSNAVLFTSDTSLFLLAHYIHIS